MPVRAEATVARAEVRVHRVRARMGKGLEHRDQEHRGAAPEHQAAVRGPALRASVAGPAHLPETRPRLDPG